MDNFKRAIKKHIPERSWNNLREKWLDNLPIIESPGSAPEHDLSDFYLLEEELESRRKNGLYPGSSFITLKKELKGLRPLIFREGLFLLHKASHVLGVAELQVRKGILTWSLSNAYQGGIFAARAIIRFLGVATVSIENKSWIIDIYPELEKLSSKERKRGLVPMPNTFFILIRKRVENRHMWQLFQRLMRVSKFHDEILNNLKKTFSDLDVSSFAKQRNRLHYSNHIWLFNDLYEFLEDTSFGLRDILPHIDLQLDDIVSDFTMILTFSIFHFGFSLLESLAEKTKKINAELDLIKDSFSSKRHPIYANTIGN